MRSLIWALVLCCAPAFGQLIPPPCAAYVWNGSSWAPLTVAGGTAYGFTPPACALDVFGTTWQAWSSTGGIGPSLSFTPSPITAYVFNSTWAPLVATTPGTKVGFTPPPRAIFAFNGTGWVPWSGVSGTVGTAVSFTPPSYGVYAGSPGSSAPWNGSVGPPSGTYIITAFNEAAAGTNLAGTTPATCANGCVGPWTLAGGTDMTYQSGGGVLGSTTNTNYDLINSGHTDETIRINVVSNGGLGQVALRYTDANNFIVLSICNGSPSCNGVSTGYGLFDDVGGTFTPIGSGVSSSPTGNYTIVLSGTSVTVTGPSGSISGTTANTGTKLGPALRIGTPFELGSLSALSQ